jgi:hypothetical protein
MKWNATTLRDIARACKRQAAFEASEAERMGGTTAADTFKAAEQRFLGYVVTLEELANQRSGEEHKQRLAEINGSSPSQPSPSRLKSQG